jgi:hypothetical protein
MKSTLPFDSIPSRFIRKVWASSSMNHESKQSSECTTESRREYLMAFDDRSLFSNKLLDIKHASHPKNAAVRFTSQLNYSLCAVQLSLSCATYTYISCVVIRFHSLSFTPCFDLINSGEQRN